MTTAGGCGDSGEVASATEGPASTDGSTMGATSEPTVDPPPTNPTDDDTTEGGGNTQGMTSNPTTSTTHGPTGPGDTTDTTASTGPDPDTGSSTVDASASGTDTSSGSDSSGSDSSTGSSGDSSSSSSGDSSSTGTTTDTTGTTGTSTTEPACPAANVCGDLCCEDGQLCLGDQACVLDCGGGVFPCGPQEECCGDGFACENDQCVIDCGGPEPCGPNQECCGAGDECVEEQCIKDCGADPPCGPQEDCCAADEICHLGECVVPGNACAQTSCATIMQNDCAIGEVCDPQLNVCLPSKADPTCQYIPPAQTFDPEPQFTWGLRKVVACTMDSQCQVSETCTNSVCTPTWPHLDIAANDLPNARQSSSTAAVVDLDKDCVPDIVFNTYGTNVNGNGVLRAIRGDTGAKIWTVNNTAWETNGTANPAVGDVNGDGNVEIYVAGENNQILAFSHTGTLLWKSAQTLSSGNTSPAVAIANIDNAGDAEILHGSEVFNSSGTKVFNGNSGRGVNNQGPISCVADLDGDGRPELLAGRTAYKFTGLVADNTLMGSVLWNTGVGGDGFCGVADFNNDQKPEVIRVASGKIYAHNGQTGAQIAVVNIPSGGNGGPPNIADFDGDGVPDVAAAGSTAYIVHKFNGTTFTKLWSAPTDDTTSQVTGSSVFDFDGDGRNEVVYNDEVYLRIYPGVEPDCLENPIGPLCDGNMTDAEVLFRDKNGSRTRTEYPVIADVDGDFKAEIVFPTNNDLADATLKLDSGLEVWGDALDNWVGTRPVWNQHTYHITNVIDLV